MKMLIGIIFLLLSMTIYAAQTAPVGGFTRNFVTTDPILNAKITILESGETITTDNTGHFGPIDWPIGKPITFVIEKIGFRTTQTATMIVPPEGLTSKYNNFSLQPVDSFTFALLTSILGEKLDESKCHVATTVLGFHKTLEDLPQGEKESQIVLMPFSSETPFYFDIFKDGPLKDYPNPFTKGLTQTSADGGVVFANLEPRDDYYTLTAIKPGVGFTQTKFLCRKGVFINVSPPLGPMADV